MITVKWTIWNVQRTKFTCIHYQVVVKLKDSSEEATVFECNRWLDVNEDDGLIVREITAGGSQMLSSKSFVSSSSMYMTRVMLP